MTLFEEIVKEALGAEITKKASDVDVNPTDAQKKAGNYKMGHVRINGFAITVENPKGSYRRGKDKDGNDWKRKMTAHYGYFTKTVGKDGDAIDVFIGEHPESGKIYIVDQVDEKGNFDESKVMFCYRNKKEAKNGYLSNYSKGWKGFKTITGVDKDIFKKWLYDGHRQRKPFSEYVGMRTLKESAKDSCSGIVIPAEDTNRVMARLDEEICFPNGEVEKFLNEDRHYPKFLEPLVEECYTDAVNAINYCKMEGKKGFSGEFRVKNNAYFDSIVLNIGIIDSDTINIGNNAGAYGGCQGFKDGKLILPQINITIPHKATNAQLATFLRSVFTHELQHSFDDWVELKTKNRKIDSRESLRQDYSFRVNNFSKSRLYEACCCLAYLSSDTETKAHIAEVYRNLSNIGATPENYKSKLPEIYLYNVLGRIKNILIPTISSASPQELSELNAVLHNNYPQSSIPKWKTSEISDRDIPAYKEKILSWGNGIYNNLLKKMYGVISLYLDDYGKENFPTGKLLELSINL